MPVVGLGRPAARRGVACAARVRAGRSRARDALADVLEDRDWLGKRGRVIAFHGAAAYRREHPTDWSTLEDILGEAAEFWKERHVAFWVFVA
jgi:hypothetical protein